MRKAIITLLLAGLILASFGCRSSRIDAGAGQTTGQELLDLKQAYDAGIISDKEFERKRKQILKD